MELYIYKTNIETKENVLSLHGLFTKYKEIKRWTVDTEDIDKVLKIETINRLKEADFLYEIQQAGYSCEVLSN